MFGGISDKRKITKVSEEGVTLNINGFCVFGGADIKISTACGFGDVKAFYGAFKRIRVLPIFDIYFFIIANALADATMRELG